MREGATWWRMCGDHLKIAIWLVGACQIRDGAPRLIAPIDDIARFHGMSRMKIRRALDAMERTGFCRVWGQRGRGGLTQIVLNDARPFGMPNTTGLLQDGNHEENFRSDDCSELAFLAPADHLRQLARPEPNQMVGGGDPTIKPTILEISQVPETTDPSYLDLLRSSEDPDLRSDLRSSASQDLTRSKESVLMVATIQVSGELKASHDPDEPATRIAVERIPERSFAAADYLRTALLAESKTAVIGTIKWSVTTKTGRRLAWADSFRKLHVSVLAGMRNGAPDTSETTAWEEIARTVHWIFHGQTCDLKYRLVVESPDTLKDKWDAIQATRRRQRLEASQPKKLTNSYRNGVGGQPMIRPRYDDDLPPGIRR